MPVNSSILENGLRIVTQSLPGSRSISIGLLVACGSRDEEPGEEGLAHLCEHMMFQGTSNRSALEIARQIDGIGGQVNGLTTKDYTCYFATVPQNYSFHALDLLADVLLNSVFPEQALERARRTALSELLSGDDDASRVLHRELKSAAWQGHPLAKPVIGLRQPLESHAREDLIYFINRHYTPDRIILAAAGKLEHEDFVAQSRDCFWRMLGQSQPAPPSPAAFHAGRWMAESSRAQCRFCAAIAAPPYGDHRRYDFHLLSQILAGGLSSRLFRRLREDMQLVYDVHSDYHAYREGGTLVVESCADPADAAPVLASILATISGMISGEDPVTEEELWVAKLRMQGLHELGSQDPHTVMSRLATQEFYFGSQIPSERILAAINDVNLTSLRRSLESFAGSDRAEVAFAGLVPHGAGVEGQLRSVLETGAGQERTCQLTSQ
jgi:predicted Zn-dependent peptidase